MYVTSVSIDDNDTELDEIYTGRQVSTGLVEELIRRLDGTRHTTVTLERLGDASMTVGGKAGVGFVVFENRDDTYHVLSADDVISRALGRHHPELVDAERAVRAAQEFALSGRLAANQVWQRI